MTNRFIPLTTAAAGGLLTAVFLQTALAVADPDSGSDTGFTIGDLSFTDPAVTTLLGGSTPGYDLISPLFSNAPLLSLGATGFLGVFFSGPQQFTLVDSDGTTLGTVATNISDQDLLGINSAQFTVFSTDPAAGLSDSHAAEIPADGTVYSITNLGGGFANVYQAVPNTDGTAASSITDTLVTPLGNINVPTSFDAIAPLEPGAPLEALGNASGDTGLSDDAFTIGATTFDPGSDGFAPASASLASIAPLLKFGAGSLDLNLRGHVGPTQDFEVYSNGTDDGTVHTSLFTSDLLGIDSTQFTVQGVTPTGDASDLPAVGTVYSVTNLGGGFENVYEAVPNIDGTAASSITDTLVTPFGDINVPTTYDAIGPMDPAAPLGNLAATSSNPDISDNAFTLEGTTFDPGADGFNTAMSYPLFGIAPLLEISGYKQGELGFPTQDGVQIYDSSGADLGSVNLGEQMSNILGIDTTQFTVSSVDAADGLSSAQTAELPAVGTVYSVTDLGSWTNVYEAIPNADGTAASSITDTLITPFGDIDLSKLFSGFDAIAPLDPGAAADGVSTATSGFDLFDPSTWF